MHAYIQQYKYYNILLNNNKKKMSSKATIFNLTSFYSVINKNDREKRFIDPRYSAYIL